MQRAPSAATDAPPASVNGADPYASYTCATATMSNKGTLKSPALGEQYCLVNDEETLFENQGELMKNLQDKLKADHSSPIVQRGFHAKHHGCLKGTFTVKDRISKNAQFGLFKTPGTYKVISRFSNGIGFTQDDNSPDMRGLAFKVFGNGSDGAFTAEEPNVHTQDFVMTNHPTPVGKDSTEFMDFAVANVEGGSKFGFFVATHPETSGRTLFAIATHQFEGKMNSMATEPYWSGTPFRLGSKQAVKFRMEPEQTDNSFAVSHSNYDYLRQELLARSRSEQIKFKFIVQYQRDPNKTPVEDPFKFWDTAGVKEEVLGELVFFKQDFVSEEKQQYCEHLSMNVWHTEKDLEPMGNLNRSRRVVYRESTRHRSAGETVPQELTVQDVERVFGPFQDE